MKRWFGWVKKAVIRAAGVLLNPRLLLCFGIAWMITNGWSYVALGVGFFLDIEWMITAATVYLSVLWLPFTPEKIITVIVAIWLLSRIFPNDQKTLAVLKNELGRLRRPKDK